MYLFQTHKTTKKISHFAVFVNKKLEINQTLVFIFRCSRCSGCTSRNFWYRVVLVFLQICRCPRCTGCAICTCYSAKTPSAPVAKLTFSTYSQLATAFTPQRRLCHPERSEGYGAFVILTCLPQAGSSPGGYSINPCTLLMFVFGGEFNLFYQKFGWGVLSLKAGAF